MDGVLKWPKILQFKKRYFYRKAQQLQKKSSGVTPKHMKDAEILHTWKTWIEKNLPGPIFR